MRVFLTRPSELGAAEIAAWHAMQQATPSLANPFLSPEFAVAVGRARPSAEVAILTEGPSISGFFPFERRRLGLGLPMGGWLSHCQGLVHAPGADWEPRELLRGCRLAAWQFDNLIADQQPFRPFHAGTGSSPVLDLADGFAAYYSKLRVRAPRFCRELNRKTRKLGREVGEVRIVSDSCDNTLLHTLIDWKSDQYDRTGSVNSFERPWVVGLLEALLASRGTHASGLLSVLFAGEVPVAAQFGLRTGHVLVGWFTGYDRRFAKYSPGMIHIMQMARHLAANGIVSISMGKGATRYANILENQHVLVAEGMVTRSSTLGALHSARDRSARWVMSTIREHPRLHRVTDRALRRSGLSRRIYGRILGRPAGRGVGKFTRFRHMARTPEVRLRPCCCPVPYLPCS